MAEFIRSLSFLWVAPWSDTLAGVLWCLWLGAVLATVYAWFRRRVYGKALNALIDKGADAPEKALTPAELGLSGAALRALKSPDRLVRREGEGYYLPPEEAQKAAAVRRMGPTALWQIPLVALGGYALLVAAWHLLPLILEFKL